MNSPAKDLAKYIVSADYTSIRGYGENADWGVFITVEPNSPANVITLYDTGGEGLDTDELDLAQPSIQVRVRCENYSNGYAIQELIRDLLTLTAPIVCETSTFVGVMMSSDIISIGRDENNRHVLTANYRTIREI